MVEGGRVQGAPSPVQAVTFLPLPTPAAGSAVTRLANHRLRLSICLTGLVRISGRLEEDARGERRQEFEM